MINKKLWGVGLLCWCCMVGLQAQDVKADLKRLYQNFDGLSNLYFELENTIVKGKEIGLEQKSKIYKKGGQYYYQMDQYEVLVNQRYILVVDNQEKTIVCRDWNQEKAAQLKAQKIPRVEELLTRYPKVTYQGVVEGFKKYTLENDQEMIQRIDLFLDRESGFAKKTIYYYHNNSVAAGAQLQMHVPVIQTKPTFPKGCFSERQFIQTQNGELRPAARYAQYTIHDLRLPPSK